MIVDKATYATNGGDRNPLILRSTKNRGITLRFEIVSVRSVTENVREIFGNIADETGSRFSFLANGITLQQVYEFAVARFYDDLFHSYMGLPALGILEFWNKIQVRL